MKRKTLATWLALLLGAFGVHWFYLGRKTGWLYLLFFPLAFYLSFLDAIRLGLMPDEKWNATYNPELPADTPQTSGLTVTAVALALGAGVTLLVSTLAIIFQWYFVGVAA
jgi:TM2 domain-containing membrane protein YozV